MTVVVDTSVLVAFVNIRDPLHAEARTLMDRVLAGELGIAVAPDLVLAEGLTLLRRRPGREDVSRQFASLFFPSPGLRPPVALRLSGAPRLDAALQLHFEHYGRGLSFADCVLATLARELGAPVASFDRGFDGLVPRIPAPA